MTKSFKSCNHKFEILDYPTIEHGYLFYCLFCLDIKEKHFVKGEGEE